MDKNWEKLANFDKLLDKLYRKQISKPSIYLIEFCKLVLESAGVDYKESDNLLEFIFNDKFDFETKRFIAICLLRLLNVNDKLFQETSFRVEVFKLFDDVCSHDIYKHLKIDVKEQPYEKESKLKVAISEIERELSESISSFGNLSYLKNFQHRFMRSINAKFNRTILLPFLPKELHGARLEEVFKLVKEYLNKKGTKALSPYKNAKKFLKQYVSETNKYKTRYCHEFLGEVGKKLLNLIESHFQENPASKPAKLIIEKFEKKYPFYIAEKEVNLVLILRNTGFGYAFNVEVMSDATISILESKQMQYLGEIAPQSSVDIQIPCKTEQSEENILIETRISWNNFDETHREKKFEFEFECQRKDIDWEKLRKEQPFSLNPATKEDEFVGRTKILGKLESLVTRDDVGSAFIYGQKRVGKTSIAKIFKTRLEKRYGSDFLIVYLEGGDYINPDAKTTIENLGKKLVRRIQNLDKRFARLDIPIFKSALAPISDFLEDLIQIAPKLRIIFILDEFDELPVELYKRSPIADAFFLTLRSISGKPPLGFILVGGEKMEYIMSCQGDALNKFQPIRVDYFDKEQNWSDFQDLVRRPVIDWLEVSDRALLNLYEQTSGNPFFTKLICAELFNMMWQHRDCDVTNREIEDATKESLRNVASNVFQHFWEDGIVYTGPKAEEKSVQRRKLLLIITNAIRKKGSAKKEYIKRKCDEWGLSDKFVEDELHEFIRRQVLNENNSIYTCKIRFFERWLVDKGFNEIVTTLVDYDALTKQKQEEEQARVTSEEIRQLVGKWGVYKGREITDNLVRMWLNQFEDNKKQRLMFKILQNIKFYTSSNVRAKLKEAHDIVKRGLIWKIKGRQKKRSDILISYLDQPGKSGALLVKIYRDENLIYYENVIEKYNITKELVKKSKRESPFALVFIDDFIGTGNSACDYFKEIVKEHGKILKRLSQEPSESENVPKLKIYFITICGFQKAQAKIEKVLNELGILAEVHVCDPLTEADKAFSSKSKIFENANQREEAKKIAYEYGAKLEKKNPLGYGDCQSTVVFEYNCPNNDLPILWKQSKEFTPVFKR